jgi:hypothetical protein
MFCPLVASVGDVEELTTVSTGLMDCGWTQVDPQTAPCIKFHAIAADGRIPLKEDGVISIRLQQRFAHPIGLEAFERRIIEEYGQPTLNWMSSPAVCTLSKPSDEAQ